MRERQRQTKRELISGNDRGGETPILTEERERHGERETDRQAGRQAGRQRA